MTQKNDVTTGQDSDEGTVPWYRKMWEACQVLEGHQLKLDNAVDKVRRGYNRYLDVALSVNAIDPGNFAWILGVIHFKEASCNFNGVLHNGEQIIGTRRKTRIVPKGRGPFATWEDAAVDAILIDTKRWDKVIKGSTDIGEILWSLERYNGTGYLTGAGRKETTPYLWACSNINDGAGKYVSDGKFDPNATTLKAIGAALILKELTKEGRFVVS